ncbi:MAG TPA: GWxTD domain-containing protein [Candidatus Eisenbacteria bacterium]|jgi:GWxTD domain-containing protein
MHRPAAIALAVSMILVAAAAAAAPDTREAKADSLVAEGRARFAKGGFGEHREAIRLLEEASQLEPKRASTLEALGRAYLDAGFNHHARVAFEKAARADAKNPEAWFGLAQLYKRNWLRSLADEDFDRAVSNAEATLRLDRGHCGAAVMLAVLRSERGEFASARGVVAEARAGACRAPELDLAAAYLAYRAGDATVAESLLAAVRPRLAPQVAARFDDVVPMLGAEDAEAVAALSARDRQRHAQQFWAGSDPDPTTPLNEALVEYHARVAHAVLVFADTWNARWDMRAALYVRYGAPGKVTFNPVGVNDGYRLNKAEAFWTSADGSMIREITQHMDMPMNVQVWEYPQLGMRVEIRDMVLSQIYEMPREDSLEVEARVDTAAVEKSGLATVGAGRAVFSPLLPGVHRLDVLGRVSQFASATGPHLLAQFEMPGTPADTLAAECVVLDSTGHTVARASAHPDPSRCDPAARRTMEFAFDLSAGRYRLAFGVSDARGGRGVARTTVAVPEPAAGLALSDIVPVCGDYDPGAGGGPVRLAPNVESRVAEDSRFHAYFEVYGLSTNASGIARFDLVYEVHDLAEHPAPWYRRLVGARPHARMAVRAEETSPGPLRRQFVQLPIAALPAGEYRLDITVHDMLRGSSVVRSLEFVK